MDSSLRARLPKGGDPEGSERVGAPDGTPQGANGRLEPMNAHEPRSMGRGVEGEEGREGNGRHQADSSPWPRRR